MILIRMRIALLLFPPAGVLFGAAPSLALRMPTLAPSGRPGGHARPGGPEEVFGPGAAA